MNLDEQAINLVKDYFESISQNAIDISYESIRGETTFAEFMEAVNQKINQFSSELVASEVLRMSAKSIENYKGGEGVDVEYVQSLLESGEGMETDEDDDEE